MKSPRIAFAFLLCALPALAQSPTSVPENPRTEALWHKPPFGADGASLRAALKNSCDVFAKRPADKPISADPRFGTNGQWQTFWNSLLLSA